MSVDNLSNSCKSTQRERNISQELRGGNDLDNTHEEEEAFPAVIPLNVGGHTFVTRLSTLLKDRNSMLAAMFSGRHKLDRDKQGYYFLDSNGSNFRYILDFLRYEKLPPNSVVLEVYQEASYYNMTRLIEKLELYPSIAKMHVADAHRGLFPNYMEVKNKLIKSAIQNATVKKMGIVTIHAFREMFIPNSNCFDQTHTCIANTADIEVGPWESQAGEEIFIKSLENDLIEEGFNVKLWSKKQCKYYSAQNCEKCVFEIAIQF